MPTINDFDKLRMAYGFAHRVPISRLEHEAFSHLESRNALFEALEHPVPRPTDDSIHAALCVEEGCARCCR